MKIMLTSSGLVTEELFAEATKLLNKDPQVASVAIINEASKVEQSDKRWIIRHLNDLDNFFGGNIEIVDLQALALDESLERLRASDAIYVLGGDADYLMDIYEKSGLDKHIEELLETRLYIGCSAGAMVLAKRTDTKIYDQLFKERIRVEKKQYLNLIDYIILPHKDDEKFPNVTEQKIREVFDIEKEKILAPTREQAIIINDSDTYFIGGEVFGSNNRK